MLSWCMPAVAWMKKESNAIPCILQAAGSQFSVEQAPPVERRRWACLPCWRSAPSAQSDIFGKKWITLLDVTDTR